jgi:O-antigen/teichoic acid export membrane protein
MAGSLARNVIANYVGQGWAGVMGLVFLPAYVHFLGIESYALVGLYSILQSWLSLLDLGMSPTLNREMARYTGGAHDAQGINDLMRSMELICFTLALCIGLAIWGASGWLAADWLHSGSLPIDVVAKAITVMALVASLRFCEGIYRSALFGLQRQVWYNAVFAILATLRWGGSVAVLAFISPTIEAFFFCQAAVSLLSVCTFAFGVHRRLPRPPRRPQFSQTALLGIRGFAGSMILITILVLLLTQVDKMLLSRYLPLAEFGYYTLAASVAGALTLVASPVSQAFYPRLTELVLNKDNSTLTRIYHQGAQLVAVLVIPPALVIILQAAAVVRVWSGNEDLATHAAPLLAVLATGTMCNCLMVMPYMLQLADGWTALTVRANLAGVLVLVPAILWAAPRYGAIGAAFAWLALNLAYVLISIHFMHRRLLPGEKWRWYGVDVLVPLLACLAVMALWGWAVPQATERFWLGVQLVCLAVCGFVASALVVPATRALLFGAFARMRSA